MKTVSVVLASVLAISMISSAFAKNISYHIISQGNQISCVAATQKNHSSLCGAGFEFHTLNPYASYVYHTGTQILSVKIDGQVWRTKILARDSEKTLCESFPHSLFGVPKIHSFEYCENPTNNYIQINYFFHYPDHHGIIYSSEKMRVNLLDGGSADIHFIHTALSPQ